MQFAVEVQMTDGLPLFFLCIELLMLSYSHVLHEFSVWYMNKYLFIPEQKLTAEQRNNLTESISVDSYFYWGYLREHG